MTGFLDHFMTIFKPAHDVMHVTSRGTMSGPANLSYDAQHISISYGDQKQILGWDEVEFVVIRIEEDLAPFPFWYVGNHSRQLRIPNDTAGADELFFEGFSEFLPGFRDNETFKIISEASIALEGSFLVWHSKTTPIA